MAFIEPLDLESILINIFSGDLKIFTAIALFFITGMAAYFRMSFLITIYMLGLFFIMFAGYVDQSIYFLIVSIGGLVVGYWISKIVKN